MTVGWLMFLQVVSRGEFTQSLAIASPFFGPGVLTFLAVHPFNAYHDREIIAAMLWIGCYLLAAVVLLLAVAHTFEGCLGRVRQRRQRAA